MANTDPPDEVDDGESPADGNGGTPYADALEEKVSDGVEHHHRQHEGNAETQKPSVGGGTGQHDGADFLRDRAEGVARLDYRSPVCIDRRFVLLAHAACEIPQGLKPYSISTLNGAA